jgi:hypothetical protein
MYEIMVDWSTANDPRYDVCYTVYEVTETDDVISHGFIADTWDNYTVKQIREKVKQYYPEITDETPVEFGTYNNQTVEECFYSV